MDHVGISRCPRHSVRSFAKGCSVATGGSVPTDRVAKPTVLPSLRPPLATRYCDVSPYAPGANIVPGDRVAKSAQWQHGPHLLAPRLWRTLTQPVSESSLGRWSGKGVRKKNLSRQHRWARQRRRGTRKPELPIKQYAPFG